MAWKKSVLQSAFTFFEIDLMVKKSNFTDFLFLAVLVTITIPAGAAAEPISDTANMTSNELSHRSIETFRKSKTGERDKTVWIINHLFLLLLGKESLSLILPYANASDISVIRQGFSTTADCPWGMAHDGIDITTQKNGVPIRAAARGVVEKIDLLFFEPYGWQVNVDIKHKDGFRTGYAFEILSRENSNGEAMYNNITQVHGMYEGKTVEQGAVIGDLMVVNSEALIHFGFFTNYTPICPDPYFTNNARQVILSFLRDFYPNEPNIQICYE